jgi:hypothetical protein
VDAFSSKIRKDPTLVDDPAAKREVRKTIARIHQTRSQLDAAVWLSHHAQAPAQRFALMNIGMGDGALSTK